MEQTKGIGQLLWNLREKEGVRQTQLCKGLCSHAKYVRIEYDQQEMDFFLIDRLMGRLGKSVERLTYVLPIEVYEMYELRQEIQQNICLGKWEEAEQCLEEYQKNRKAEEPLHQQFIEQEYAQIAWMRGESAETVCEHLEKAIAQTMPEAETQRKTGILSVEEYKLLLFRWEVCFGTERERGEKELQELTEEIFQKNFERTERVKVIPYAALLKAKTSQDGKQDTYLKMITETALENLREEGKLLYMPEILKQYAKILEKENGDAEFIQLLRQERASILELESDHGVSFENYRLFDHVVRNFEIDAELIRRTRTAAKLTQEKLSEDICAQETLARIENGNQKPRSGNLRQMMEKMGRSGNRIETGIQVEEYETLELKIEFSKFIHRKEYENAEKILLEIEKKLDCSVIQNRQYVESEKIKIKYQKKTESADELIRQLMELLKMSLEVKEGQKIEYVLNTLETDILTMVGFIYWGVGNYEKSREIYQFIEERYQSSRVKPIFHLLDWTLNIGNYARALEEVKEFEKAIQVCQKAIQQMLYAGKGVTIDYSLMVQACVLEETEKEKCKKYFRQNLDLLKLYKMNVNYKIMKKYVEDKKIFN